jgi:hypothetical protein
MFTELEPEASMEVPTAERFTPYLSAIQLRMTIAYTGVSAVECNNRKTNADNPGWSMIEIRHTWANEPLQATPGCAFLQRGRIGAADGWAEPRYV